MQRRAVVSGAVGLALAAFGCLAPSETTCGDGTICPGSLACAPAGGCVEPGQLAACEDQPPLAACAVPPLIPERLRIFSASPGAKSGAWRRRAEALGTAATRFAVASRATSAFRQPAAGASG
jgi:hypothetical protein